MTRLKLFVVVTLLAIGATIYGQRDTTEVIALDGVEVVGLHNRGVLIHMPQVQGAVIYSGKKNEVISVGSIDADLSVNNPRQIFARVPGVSVWENDGSGIQLGIATRGLNPNRSWEFNVRQNGYDISSEVFGYPEAYFTPPMEAVERIELIRGASSLAFGPQFGGLLNFVIKDAPADRPLAVEINKTAGTYGLFNSFIGIGGTSSRLSYYAYFHNRSAEGWRKNSRYSIQTGYLSLKYALAPGMNVGVEYTRMNYESQQPGGLTDANFAIDPRQSNRSRNWFSTPWNLMALTFDYQVNDNLKICFKGFGTIAERNSVGFMRPTTIADTFNVAINSFNPRQVDRDLYDNFGGELRVLQTYNLFGGQSSLAAGLRVYEGRTVRKQLGVGTAGNDYDITISALTNGRLYGRELDFVTDNIAFFAENLFRVGNRLSVTPGFRYEIINNSANGYINTTPEGVISNRRSEREVLLLGMGAEFKTSSETNLYANFSQAFRPVTFAELTPSTTTEVIDPDLEDVSGYNLDFGFRGNVRNYLNFDIGGFYMLYDNRIGVVQVDGNPFRTNIGTSVSQGLELYFEVHPTELLPENINLGNLSLFTSFAYINAEYTSWNNPAIANDPARSIVGKRVENAPETIARYGINFDTNGFSVTFQVNRVGDVYTDAANTVEANPNATIGRIDGFTVMDAAMSYRLSENLKLRAGVNNIADEVYATRRAGGYPGPGLLPANGRTAFVSIGARF